MIQPRHIFVRFKFLYLASAILLFVILYFAFHQSEPQYEGRPVSAWIDDLEYIYLSAPMRPSPQEIARRKRSDKAREAIDKLGTNAIPWLLAELGAHDSALKLKFYALAAKQHYIQFNFKPAQNRRDIAWQILSQRTHLLRGFVPTLTELLYNKEEPNACSMAAQLLSYQNAYDVLVRAFLQTENEAARSSALIFLADSSIDSEPVLPILISCLTNKNPLLRSSAAQVLGRIRRQVTLQLAGDWFPELEGEDFLDFKKRLPQFNSTIARALPLLANNLTNIDYLVRLHSTIALAEFGPPATTYLPLLRQGLTDPVWHVRDATTKTLLKLNRPLK